MTNQEKFETQAKEILDRNQVALDQKLFLSHWSGYAKLRSKHKKEIVDLAKKHDVNPKLRKFKMRGLWWFTH